MRTEGGDVRGFIESVCRLTKGRDAGKLIELRTWQAQLIDDLFELAEDGRRRYRRGLVLMPRKNGKSLLGSSVALFGLFEGEQGAEVYCCAGDKDQARIVFNECKRMVELDPSLSERLKLYRDAIEYPTTQSVMRVLSSDAPRHEGLNPSLVIFDELHVQPNAELYETMALGMGTRDQPLLLGISTAGVMSDRSGQDSVCFRLHKYGLQVESGEVNDRTFFYRWFGARNPDVDYRDPKVWEEANPAFGDYLLREDFEAAVKTTRESEFRIKRLCQWVAAETVWLPYGVWDGLGDAERGEPPAGAEICLGFDGSYSDDCTALVGATVEDEPHLFVLGVWERPQHDPDWTVSREAVKARVAEVFERWRVRKMWPDPFGWTSEIEEWQDAYGMVVDPLPTNVPARMGPLCDQFYVDAVSGDFTHDGDVTLARHVGNCATKETRHGVVVVKDAKASPRKIDLAVAAVLARGAATSTAAPVEPSVMLV